MGGPLEFFKSVAEDTSRGVGVKRYDMELMLSIPRNYLIYRINDQVIF